MLFFGFLGFLSFLHRAFKTKKGFTFVRIGLASASVWLFCVYFLSFMLNSASAENVHRSSPGSIKQLFNRKFSHGEAGNVQ